MYPNELITNLSEESRAKISHHLMGTTEDLETEHRPLFQKIKKYWDLYEAKPLVEIRTFPWYNASNIVVPLIQTWSDGIIHRHFNRIFSGGDRIWTAKTENATWRDLLAPWLQYLNWAARGNVFDVFTPTWDLLSEMVPIGTSYWALHWVEKQAFRYIPGAKKPSQVLMSRGPLLEHVPRDQLLCIPGLSPTDSDVVVRQRWMTRQELVRFTYGLKMVTSEVLDKVCQNPDSDTSSPSTNRQEADRRAGYAGNRPVPLWDIREAWISYPELKASKLDAALGVEGYDHDEPMATLVCLFHRGTGEILNISPHPYYFSHNPFYDVHLRRRPGRADSDGVAARGEHLQRGATTIINQAIDAVTLANSVNFKTTDRRLEGFKFAPMTPIPVSRMDELDVIQLGKLVTPDIALFNSLLAIGERLFSVTDPALGRETRLGGHPSPATSTLAMLEQLDINLSTSLRFLRHRLSQIGEDISTLFQQFEAASSPLEGDDTKGRVFAALGAEDANIVEQLILPLDRPITPDVRFDIFALSEGADPNADRQKVVLEFQFLQNYYSSLIGLGQLLQTPAGQDPMIKEVALQAMRTFTTTTKRFLETTNFDEIEDVLVDIQQGNTSNAAASEQLLNMARSVGGPQGPSGAVPIPGMARVPYGGPGPRPGANGPPPDGL